MTEWLQEENIQRERGYKFTVSGRLLTSVTHQHCALLTHTSLSTLQWASLPCN